MKIILILFTLISITFAQVQSIEKKYKLSYGIIGELGVAHASINVDKENSYIIKMHVKTTGIAKFLSQNKEEIYISKGVVKQNQFIPHIFIKNVKNDVKTKEKIYTIDHINKVVHKKNITNKKNRTTGKWEKNSNSEIIEYYAKNDILSLFFNLKYYIKEFTPGVEHNLYAVGANKDNGLINIIVPTSKKFKKINEDLKTDQKTILTVFINQKIFSSDRGELFISLDQNGFCDKTVLKDVLLFGDIRGKSIN